MPRPEAQRPYLSACHAGLLGNKWTPVRGASYSRQICSFGNEDELATSRRSLPIPGLGNLLKRNHLPLDRAAACSGVCEDLREGLGFLLAGQRIVGIAQDSMQTATHYGSLKPRPRSRGRAAI